MSDKKKSLSKKSIRHLGILGIVLFLGTGLAAGIQLYKQNLKIYKDAAESYVNMLAFQIESKDLREIIESEEEIRDLLTNLSELYEENGDLNSDNEAYKKIVNEADNDLINLYNQWVDIDNFVLGFGNICRDIRYAYVVIPTEDDLIYVWDSDLDSNMSTLLFDHNPYSGNEKEYIQAVMNGEEESVFFTESINGELLGTSLSPIMSPDEEILAVGAIDISISSIRIAFLKLLRNIGAAILVIMLVSITMYHYVFRRQILNPIVKLTRAADGLVSSLRIEDSELLRIDIHTGDEIDVLARSFERMDEKLIDYILENASITAEKERIGTELDLAARIQRDMLPGIFPPFPDRKEIDLYASMKPAKEVGGDFYDFFMGDENQLWVAVADVSGKGIPAALFMMMSRIMVQNFSLTLGSPGEVLERMNDQICNNPVEEMFVTVWLGVLDLETGLLTAANAGHEYPIVLAPSEDFKLIRDRHGLVVGGIEGYHYREYQMQLEPGSRLFLYTDGLPEASNAGDEMFGIERTLKVLNEVKDGTPKEVLEHVRQSVIDFTGDAPQFDDMTMLCLDYYGKPIGTIQNPS